MTPTIELLKTVRNATTAVGLNWAIVDDYLFDDYKASVQTLEWLGGPSRIVPKYEHLMFKDIRIYPMRAKYPGPQ